MGRAVQKHKEEVPHESRLSGKYRICELELARGRARA